ncbi:MAG TPA: hypothetical protein VF715_02955 [Thermoleophilaceae bacterium]
MPPRNWTIAGRALRSGVALSAALAVVPGAAGAATHNLRPDGQTLTGWGVVPSGGTQWDTLNDAVVQPALPSTASDYLTSVTNVVAQNELTLETAAIPAGESVTGAKVWFYAQTGTTRNLLVWASHQGGLVANATIPANSPAGWYQLAIPVPLTQAQVDALKIGFTHNGNTGTHSLLYAAYVQLDVSDPAPPPPPEDPPPPPPEDPPPPPPEDPPPPPPPPPPEDPPPPPVDPPIDPPVLPPVDPPVDPPTLPPLDPPTLPPVDPGVIVPPVDPGVIVPPIDPVVDPPVLPPVKPPEIIEVEEPALSIIGKEPTASPTGVVPLTVSCPATEVNGCEGTIWLEEPLDAGSKNQEIRGARRSPKRFSKPKRYKLKQGKKMTVPVQLDRRVHRKFKKKRSFKVTVVAQQKDSTGTVQTMRRTVRVFNSKKRKR